MDLVERAKRLLLTPRQEWAAIDAEQITPRALYTGYVMPLAAIGPIAQFIGFALVGVRLPYSGTYRAPIVSTLVSEIVSYVLTLVGVYVLGLIIDGLAPSFGGTKSPMQALKV